MILFWIHRLVSYSPLIAEVILNYHYKITVFKNSEHCTGTVNWNCNSKFSRIDLYNTLCASWTFLFAFSFASKYNLFKTSSEHWPFFQSLALITRSNSAEYLVFHREVKALNLWCGFTVDLSFSIRCVVLGKAGGLFASCTSVAFRVTFKGLRSMELAIEKISSWIRHEWK